MTAKFKEYFRNGVQINHTLMKFKRETNKMSEETTFKEVTGGDVFQFNEVNDAIEGKYLESVAGQFGDNYIVQIEDGTEKTVFGGTVINTKMARVKVGDIVRITYLGEVKAESSGRVYKDFKVEVA